MLGKKIAGVKVSSDQSTIIFTFQDGFSRSFGVAGDCCSYSWIEHLEMPTSVEGATLTGAYDSAPITQDHSEHDEEKSTDPHIQVYNTVFTTDRGEIVLEYRNSSNGYYGGYLVDVGA